jgi:hypothetical protein
MQVVGKRPQAESVSGGSVKTASNIWRSNDDLFRIPLPCIRSGFTGVETQAIAPNSFAATPNSCEAAALLQQVEICMQVRLKPELEVQRTLLMMAALIRELEKIHPGAFVAEGAEVRRYAAGETPSYSEGMDLTRRLRKRMAALDAVKS